MQAYNFITLVKYSGSNAGLQGRTDINAFATYLQLKQAGYSVNKGAKAERIFTGYYEKTKDNGEVDTVPTFACVFDIADTDAIKDTDFINWLKTEAVLVDSIQEVNSKIMATVLA